MVPAGVLPVDRYSASEPLGTGVLWTERSAGGLLGKCILQLSVFFSFLAKQSLIPAAWEKGRSGAWPSAHRWALFIAAVLGQGVLERHRNSFFRIELNVFKTFSLNGYLNTMVEAAHVYPSKERRPGCRGGAGVRGRWTSSFSPCGP